MMVNVQHQPTNSSTHAKHRQRRWRNWWFVVLALLVAVMGLSACGGTDDIRVPDETPTPFFYDYDDSGGGSKMGTQGTALQKLYENQSDIHILATLSFFSKSTVVFAVESVNWSPKANSYLHYRGVSVAFPYGQNTVLQLPETVHSVVIVPFPDDENVNRFVMITDAGYFLVDANTNRVIHVPWIGDNALPPGIGYLQYPATSRLHKYLFITVPGQSTAKAYFPDKHVWRDVTLPVAAGKKSWVIANRDVTYFVTWRDGRATVYATDALSWDEEYNLANETLEWRRLATLKTEGDILPGINGRALAVPMHNGDTVDVALFGMPDLPDVVVYPVQRGGGGSSTYGDLYAIPVPSEDAAIVVMRLTWTISTIVPGQVVSPDGKVAYMTYSVLDMTQGIKDGDYKADLYPCAALSSGAGFQTAMQPHLLPTTDERYVEEAAFAPGGHGLGGLFFVSKRAPTGLRALEFSSVSPTSVLAHTYESGFVINNLGACYASPAMP